MQKQIRSSDVFAFCRVQERISLPLLPVRCCGEIRGPMETRGWDRGNPESCCQDLKKRRVTDRPHAHRALSPEEY